MGYSVGLCTASRGSADPGDSDIDAHAEREFASYIRVRPPDAAYAARDGSGNQEITSHTGGNRPELCTAALASVNNVGGMRRCGNRGGQTSKRTRVDKSSPWRVLYFLSPSSSGPLRWSPRVYRVRFAFEQLWSREREKLPVIHGV